MRVILYEFEFEYQDKLEKEIATHSSIYVWEIPWTEEPGGLKSQTKLWQLNHYHLLLWAKLIGKQKLIWT